MRISSINNYYTPTLQNTRKHNSSKDNLENNMNLNALPSVHNIAFNGLFSRHKKNDRPQRIRDFYGTFDKLFNTRSSYTDYDKDASPLCNASPKVEKEAREFCIRYNKESYIPYLYLHDGEKRHCVFREKLSVKDLSAVPDILAGIKKYNEVSALDYYEKMLHEISLFLADYNSKDDYVNKLCKLYDNIKTQFINIGGDENVLIDYQDVMKEIEDVEENTNTIQENISETIQPTCEYILPSPNELTTPENVLKVIDNPALKSSGGELWNKNSNIISAIADIVPTNKNQENYSKMINALKELNHINYNQKDAYGISILEKIMNSENIQFLELLKNHSLDYSPELEFAYKNIQDNNFKNKLKEINIRFPDLEKAIKLNSVKGLMAAMEQITSPLLNDSAKECIQKILNKPQCRNVDSSAYLSLGWIPEIKKTAQTQNVELERYLILGMF